MGSVSRVALAALRVWQLICAIIVLGILARFLHVLSEAGAARDGRVIYGIVVASITIIFAILFIAPFMYSSWPFRATLHSSSCGLVLFCLLITRTGTNTCSSPWFSNYWGYYWGGWWTRPYFNTPTNIARSGCGHWRTVLAFSFMAMFAFLASACLGAYIVHRHWTKKRTDRRAGTTATTGNPPTSQIGGSTQTGGVVSMPQEQPPGQPLSRPQLGMRALTCKGVSMRARSQETAAVYEKLRFTQTGFHLNALGMKARDKD